MVSRIFIRDDADDVIRARCIRLLRGLGMDVRVQHRQGFDLGQSISLDDLATEKLVDLAKRDIATFWLHRRIRSGNLALRRAG